MKLNKTELDVRLIKESILHWEEMTERAKWLIESGIEWHADDDLSGWFLMTCETVWSGKCCPLCQQYHPAFIHNSGCIGCPMLQFDQPCTSVESAYGKFCFYVQSLSDVPYCAEKYMLPMLYFVLKSVRSK